MKVEHSFLMPRRDVWEVKEDRKRPEIAHWIRAVDHKFRQRPGNPEWQATYTLPSVGSRCWTSWSSRSHAPPWVISTCLVQVGSEIGERSNTLYTWGQTSPSFCVCNVLCPNQQYITMLLGPLCGPGRVGASLWITGAQPLPYQYWCKPGPKGKMRGQSVVPLKPPETCKLRWELCAGDFTQHH